MFGIGTFVSEARPGGKNEEAEALSCFRDSPGKYVALGVPVSRHVSQRRSLINSKNERMMRWVISKRY